MTRAPGPAADAKLIAALNDMVDLLQQLQEHFHGEADSMDGPHGEPVPNEAAKWLWRIDEALELVGSR